MNVLFSIMLIARAFLGAAAYQSYKLLAFFLKIIEAIEADDLKEVSFKGRGKTLNVVKLSEKIQKYVKENCCCFI